MQLRVDYLCLPILGSCKYLSLCVARARCVRGQPGSVHSQCSRKWTIQTLFVFISIEAYLGYCCSMSTITIDLSTEIIKAGANCLIMCELSSIYELELPLQSRVGYARGKQNARRNQNSACWLGKAVNPLLTYLY